MRRIKPAASRSESPEMYLLAEGFQLSEHPTLLLSNKWAERAQKVRSQLQAKELVEQFRRESKERGEQLAEIKEKITNEL